MNNSATCKGSYLSGTACGKCVRCAEEIMRLKNDGKLPELRPSNVPHGQANDRERSAYVQLADVLAEFEPMIFDFVESHNEENVRLFLKDVLGKYFS